MTLVLPRERYGLDSILRSLDGRQLSTYLRHKTSQGAMPADVKLTLPKFTVKCAHNLTDTVGAIGIRAAFDPERAEFGDSLVPVEPNGEVVGEKLCVNRVIQHVYLRLDEKGTEAAAVTAMFMRCCGLGGDGVPKYVQRIFKADHPFLYAIHSKDDILFIGTVRDGCFD